jgi:hypothetical protein
VCQINTQDVRALNQLVLDKAPGVGQGPMRSLKNNTTMIALAFGVGGNGD